MRVVVLAPNWLGDVVMALPAIAAVRRWFGDAHLAVAARAPVAPLLSMAAGIDEVVVLAGRGDWRDAAGRRADAQHLASSRFDLALLLPNSFHAAWLARLAGVPERWGYRADLRAMLLTRGVPKPRGPITQAAYYLALVQSLGGPDAPLAASLQISDAQRDAASALLRANGWTAGPLVAFAPGAAFGPAKRWPPDRVAQVARRLAADLGVTPVLVGAQGDLDSIAEVLRRYRALAGAGADAIDLGGRTDLLTLAGVFTLCDAVLSNDSGAMHVAAAVGVPVTAIFGPTDERATSPLPHPSGPLATIVAGQARCRPCLLRMCPIDHRCMTSIEPARVAQVVAASMGGDCGAADRATKVPPPQQREREL
ncbi:MAG: lipopolysaccharide heptosyltransferase II [Vicinamibacteria bacterium]|nr:lipopolysaccharide heptosyltransferase II [Vicinamibacteria bacterium]